MLKSSLIAKTNAKANSNQIHVQNSYRITVLTSRLIRIESSKHGSFVDEPSQTIWFRNFEEVPFSVKENKSKIIVETNDVIFTIKRSNLKPIKVLFKDSKKETPCTNSGNLRGTCRTLDGTFGKVPLEKGLISKNGVYVLDDSNSLLIDTNGKFKQRDTNDKDLYVFAYGQNYRETIKAFYKISSPVPIIPRFALGVWWSRYRRYTQEEYQNLMLRFKEENIPLTVATVDMDWHWTDLNSKFGTNYSSQKWSDNPITGGWTGYSWDTDLFPDYKEFLKFLKNENLHVTLNLHPADGVRFFETQYEEMAKAVGIDPKTKKDIPFVCGSDKFWNAYFDVLHKPYEHEGVDFWWIDWQQGKRSDVKGLDPLTALNHYHYLDNSEDGRIPLILSRYAGLGSHRYPLGFSGDTAISWKVLDFQPYFTVNATNAAYTWWSHDIGGHHHGYRDDDLYLRWLQFGVFSPIMRLHSTSDDLLGKEPWKYSKNACSCAKDYLRLRHRLIPYIYTMDYRTHKDGIALCEPMYYSYPQNNNSYDVKNQYMFGSELMVCPITKKQHSQTNLGSVSAWIPDGRWTDIFTLQAYSGEQKIELHREIENIPVLAKAGAIIPLSNDSSNSVSNPKNLDLWVFAGNGSFSLYEDNGKTDFASHHARTIFKTEFDEKSKTIKFEIQKPYGNTEVVPDNRNFRIFFKDLDYEDLSSKTLPIQIDENKTPFIEIKNLSKNENFSIVLNNAEYRKAESKKEQLIEILSRWQEKTGKKKKAYQVFRRLNETAELKEALKKAKLPSEVYSAVYERLYTE